MSILNISQIHTQYHHIVDHTVGPYCGNQSNTFNVQNFILKVDHYDKDNCNCRILKNQITYLTRA